MDTPPPPPKKHIIHFQTASAVVDAQMLLLVYFDGIEQPVCFRECSWVLRNKGFAILGLVAAGRLAVPPILVYLDSAQVGVNDDGILLEILGNAALVA